MGYGIFPIVGPPGASTPRRATPRYVFDGSAITAFLAGGAYVSGTYARDWGNTGDLDVLRAGLLMGRRSSDYYLEPSILGVTLGTSSANGTPYTAGGTSICVAPAAAVEIVRRVGASGNLTYVGPPTANGTNAVTTSIAYSAVNTTTGVITTSTIGVDKVVGTFVTSTDGSGIPLSFIPDGWGLKVTDVNGDNVLSQWPNVPVAGQLLAANLLNWPTDTSLQAWIVNSLSTFAGGKFIFADYAYYTA